MPKKKKNSLFKAIKLNKAFFFFLLFLEKAYFPQGVKKYLIMIYLTCSKHKDETFKNILDHYYSIT